MVSLFVEENGIPFGAILHCHVSSRECTFCYYIPVPMRMQLSGDPHLVFLPYAVLRRCV